MTMNEQLLKNYGDFITIELEEGASAISVAALKQTLYQFDLAELESAVGEKINERVLLDATDEKQDLRKIERAMRNVNGALIDEVDSHKTMTEYGIEEKANIYVSVDGFEILVQYEEEKIGKNGVVKLKSNPTTFMGERPPTLWQL
ncbi:hypothetical protein niasHT_024762 [Heterodera trifolii]|uniref:Phage protein n=1 Tax=Heterodera trifolii TaxID=157864 RepID=A0ABD2JGY4_9BILA